MVVRLPALQDPPSLHHNPFTLAGGDPYPDFYGYHFLVAFIVLPLMQASLKNMVTAFEFYVGGTKYKYLFIFSFLCSIVFTNIHSYCCMFICMLCSTAPGPPTDTKTHRCSSPIYKMSWYLHLIYTHPFIYFKSPLDYL